MSLWIVALLLISFSLFRPSGSPAVAAPVVDNPSLTMNVDINCASAAEIEALPGIGPVLAGSIAAYRGEKGSFGRIGDLEDISGVGKKKIEKMSPYVSLGRGGCQ